jgi:hypothetical protein
MANALARGIKPYNDSGLVEDPVLAGKPLTKNSPYSNQERARKEAGIADPIPAQSQLVNLSDDDGLNFESELRRRRNRTRTKYAGESGGSGSGGYGGSTQLGGSGGPTVPAGY